ncbi:hypothetical protein ACFUVU_01605 [Streptomyces griseoincarnatus]
MTFTLLPARTEDIIVFGESLHTIGEKLPADHSLMGRAPQLPTDVVAADFRATLDLPARTVEAVDRNRIRRGGRDTYLHLYEHSLDEYDPEPRERSGSSCTPVEVVEQMGRPTDDVLVTHLGKQRGFADPGAFTVDPAMGTGTHPHAVLERIAANAAALGGPGAVSGAVTRATERDRRSRTAEGPYAVAGLRAAKQLNSHQAVPPNGGLKLFVTGTLERWWERGRPRRTLGTGGRCVWDWSARSAIRAVRSPGRSPAWPIPLLGPVLPGLLACAATVVALRRPDGARPAG